MARRNTVNQHASVEAGRTITAIKEAPASAGSTSKLVSIASEGALISLFVNSIMGSLNISVYTLTEDGKRQKLFDFPQINTSTPELVIKTVSPTLQLIELECTYNGPCDYEVHVRGISSGQVSTKIIAPGTLSSKRVLHGTIPAVLIPATTENRSSVLIKNLSNGTLYIGGSLAEANTATGFPVAPGESIVIDIAGGQAVYAIGTSVGMDIRYMEAGE
jgi:hypothetical protein